MAYPKHLQLLSQLHSKSMKTQIEWQKSISPERFLAPFSQFTISISRVERENDDHEFYDYLISIIDTKGTLYDEFNALSLDDGSGYSYYNLARETYEAARRIALGAEKAIDSILGDLLEINDLL